jgi:hypothetical protein
MKKDIVLALAIITRLSGFAQDWQLFNINQLSYYQQHFDESIKVETFLLDSIFNNNGIDYLYFNSKSDFFDNCYTTLKKEYESFYWIKNPDKIDSILFIGDSALFIMNYASILDTFIFKPYCKVGDSWITNSIKIECTEKNIIKIFDTQDSIKVFKCIDSPYDTIEFVLSKSFGLLKFLPFKEFIYRDGLTEFPPYFEFIGFYKNGSSIGYIQPDFNDYFHPSVGDILFWRDFSIPHDTNIYYKLIEYHVDSITYVFISNDSVYYDYIRTNYNHNGEVSHIGNNYKYHLRKNEGKIVKNLTSWFGHYKTYYQESEVFISSAIFYNIENGDTISYFKYELPGLMIDTIDCFVFEVADIDLTVKFSTREGLIFEASYSWGENSTTLIGSIIDGVKYGTTEIPTIFKTIRNEQINIYPNPVIDNIILKSYNLSIRTIELYDIMGNLIFSKPYNEILNLKEIISGIYILRLIDNNKSLINLRIIKQ